MWSPMRFTRPGERTMKAGGSPNCSTKPVRARCSAVATSDIDGSQQIGLHLEVFSVRRSADKLKYLAGSESGMDVFINDITPERQADLLRAVDV